jgi:Golgi apparatus protein 1
MEKKRQAWLVCQGDREKFCKGIEPGKGLRECMKSHEAELGKECREQIQKREQHHAKWKACKGDKDRFCANVQPGEGRIRSCLKDHQKDLSPECKAAIP